MTESSVIIQILYETICHSELWPNLNMNMNFNPFQTLSALFIHVIMRNKCINYMAVEA